MQYCASRAAILLDLPSGGPLASDDWFVSASDVLSLVAPDAGFSPVVS